MRERIKLEIEFCLWFVRVYLLPKLPLILTQDRRKRNKVVGMRRRLIAWKLKIRESRGVK